MWMAYPIRLKVKKDQYFILCDFREGAKRQQILWCGQCKGYKGKSDYRPSQIEPVKISNMIAEHGKKKGKEMMAKKNVEKKYPLLRLPE